MSRPTETAQSYFAMAQSRFHSAMEKAAVHGDTIEYNLAMGHLDMCTGLTHLNTGLRATYQVLDEVRTLLQRSQLGR